MRRCVSQKFTKCKATHSRLSSSFAKVGLPAHDSGLATRLTWDPVIDARRKGATVATPRQPEQQLGRATRQKYDSAYKEERRIEREELLRREAAKETLIQNVFKHSHELERVDIEDQERVERWLAEISVVVDDFRESRELFPVDRVSTSVSGGATSRLMAFQWRLARSIRNAKMLEGELEEENMLERLESEVGQEKSKCWYFLTDKPH